MPAGRWLRTWPWILSIHGPAVAIGNLEGYWDAASAISAGTTALGAAAILTAVT